VQLVYVAPDSDAEETGDSGLTNSQGEIELRPPTVEGRNLRF